MFISIKGTQSREFDLQTYFNLNNWIKISPGSQNVAQWLPQIDTIEEGMSRLRMSALSPSGPLGGGGGSENIQTGQKRQDCCYKYPEDSCELPVQGCPI